jgi:SAM-dependent methyltransferase
MRPWHEQDEFWTTFEPMMFREERWEGAPEQIDRVLEILDLEPGAAVCDLACGPGRHALELARRGFRVTGVDRTTAYLEGARTKAAEEGLEAEWVEADMREFRRPEGFDAIVNLFTAFGYFEDPDEDLRVAENFAASLKPGGTLVMDILGKEVLARVFQPRDWERYPDGSLLLQERSVSRDWTWITAVWTLLRGSERSEFTLTHRIYSAAELKALLEKAGLVETRAFGDLDGRPYDHEAKRLVVAARRPTG